MGITPVSICGNNLSTANYTSQVERNALRGRVAGRSNSFASRACGPSTYTGSTQSPRQFAIRHFLTRDADPSVGFDAALDALEGTFYRPFGNCPSCGQGSCSFVFLDYDGVAKSVEVVPVELAADPVNRDGDDDCDEHGVYRGTWELVGPEQRATTPTVDTDTLTGSPDSTVTTTVGTAPDRSPEYQFTPSTQKAAASGQRWRIPVTVVNRSARPMVDWPVELTAGFTFNHNALVLAGDSMSSGDDIEVRSDGKRIMRWAGDTTRAWNTTDARLWANLTLPAGRAWELAATPGVGGTTAYVTGDLLDIPATPFYVYAESTGEVILVTDVDSALDTFTIERGKRGTTAASPSVGSLLWLVAPAGLVDILGGWTSAPAADYVDDRYKPAIDLDTSSNTGFTQSVYYETGTVGKTTGRYPRPASWQARSLGQYDREIGGGDGDQYWNWVARLFGDPATQVGIEYRSAGAVAGRPLIDRWEWTTPIGLSAWQVDWDATTIVYDGTTPPQLKEARLVLVEVDGDGNENRHAELDALVTAGTGTASNTPAVPVYRISARIEPYDRRLRSPGSGAALEPGDGEGWELSTFEVTFATDERVVAAGNGTRINIYEIGRPDAPATLDAGGDALSIFGAYVDVGESLVLTNRALEWNGTDVRSFGHLIRGGYPWLDPGATVTLTDTGQTGLGIQITAVSTWI